MLIATSVISSEKTAIDIYTNISFLADMTYFSLQSDWHVIIW